MYLKKKKLCISKDYRCKQLFNILENEEWNNKGQWLSHRWFYTLNCSQIFVSQYMKVLITTGRRTESKKETDRDGETIMKRNEYVDKAKAIEDGNPGVRFHT